MDTGAGRRQALLEGAHRRPPAYLAPPIARALSLAPNHFSCSQTLLYFFSLSLSLSLSLLQRRPQSTLQAWRLSRFGRANESAGNAKRKAQEGARAASLWSPSTTTPAPPLPAFPPLHPHRPPLRRQTVSSAEAVCDITMLSRTAARASRAFGAGKSAASKTATVRRPIHRPRLEVRRHQHHPNTRKKENGRHGLYMMGY